MNLVEENLVCIVVLGFCTYKDKFEQIITDLDKLYGLRRLQMKKSCSCTTSP